MKETLDWSSFTRKISIAADKQLIFDHRITQDKLEQWFLNQAIFNNEDQEPRDRFSPIVKGDTYQWSWYGSDNLAQGEIIENNKRDALRFTFLECMVSMMVKTENNENIIELTQSDIPLDEKSRMNYFVECTRGWTFYLTNLKSILEGGIDLRNKNNDLSGVINT